jgi:hypothetical protein
VCDRLQQSPSTQHMGTAVRTAKTSQASWDAFCDVDAFVDEVLTELAAMAGTRPNRSGPEPALTGAALHKAIMAIWCLCFRGMQWRSIGRLCDIPFGTLFTLFARWTRLGLWRCLLDRLRRAWRLACGDAAEPRAVVIDSRSCKLAPSCFERGFDGGKKIQGAIVEAPRSMIHLGVEKHGIPLAIDVSPANTHDTKGIVPVLCELAGQGFRGSALGDSAPGGKRLAKAGSSPSSRSPSFPSSPGASSVSRSMRSAPDVYEQRLKRGMDCLVQTIPEDMQ